MFGRSPVQTCVQAAAVSQPSLQYGGKLCPHAVLACGAVERMTELGLMPS